MPGIAPQVSGPVFFLWPEPPFSCWVLASWPIGRASLVSGGSSRPGWRLDMMKKLAVAFVASLSLLAGEATAQPAGTRAPGAQPDANVPNAAPRRPRSDQPATRPPVPPPPVVQQPPSQQQPRQSGGQPRGGPRVDRPPVVVQPAPQRGWDERPRRQPPVIYQQPPVYRPAPPVYRPAPPIIVAPGPSYGPPPNWRHRRPYNWCRAKAERLHQFEYQMQLDGRISRDELRIARSLRADLANSCGGGRWNPNRGWYYG